MFNKFSLVASTAVALVTSAAKLVVNVAELPYKCPVAPLEFSFLADDYFRKKGIRDKVDITYVTPLSGAFTKPTCTTALNYLLSSLF